MVLEMLEGGLGMVAIKCAHYDLLFQLFPSQFSSQMMIVTLSLTLLPLP